MALARVTASSSLAAAAVCVCSHVNDDSFLEIKSGSSDEEYSLSGPSKDSAALVNKKKTKKSE